uniref:Uncharacterized protein n=1 Tax=Octopus bimaculoides TaxID=37653 RepID=A0A0L8H2R0_OCTBM
MLDSACLFLFLSFFLIFLYSHLPLFPTYAFHFSYFLFLSSCQTVSPSVHSIQSLDTPVLNYMMLRLIN